jgi:hypothetical protein
MSAVASAKEFLRFLNTIDRQTPHHLDLDLIADNYATHKTPAVQRWLKKHRRFRIHFTPTSASWLNVVERFFAEITAKSIRRGAFTSVPDLENAIMAYLATHNLNPKPFVWTVKADNILAKVVRAKQVLVRGSTLATASPRDPFDFLANEALDQGRKMFIKPLLQQRPQQIARDVLYRSPARRAADQRIGKTAEGRPRARGSFW